MGASFLSVLSLGGYQTIPTLQKTRMNKRKKGRTRGKGKIQARKQHMARMETWTGWDGMDGWMACLFPFYLPSITAIAIRYLAVGSG